MDKKDPRTELILFQESLQSVVFDALSDKKIDLSMLTAEIVAGYEFVRYETEAIFEGVLRVLKGEDSASNLVAFIEKDQNIEEDNRPKIGSLAYELQTRLFDTALPLLKQAGFPIKEGRVTKPIVNSQVSRQTLSEQSSVGQASINGQPGVVSPYAPVPSPASYSSFSKGGAEVGEGGGFRNPSTPQKAVLPLGKGESALPPLEEKNMRAIIRIAAGTKYSEDDLRGAFESLPQGLRQSLSSVDTANAVQTIAKKYLLHVDQMAALASETGLVLLGLTHPAEFIGNLAGRLRVNEGQAKEIARDISAQVLVKVRDALRGIHESPLSKGALPSSAGGLSQPPKAAPFVKGDSVPLPKLNVMPQSRIQNSEFRIQESKIPRPLGTDRGELPMANTPYSVGAKWNTGENILKKQAESEVPLDRATVLRDIENPRGIPVSTPRVESRGGLRPAASVGPTGWKPPAADLPAMPAHAGQAGGGKSQFPIPNSQTNPNQQNPNRQIAPAITPPPRPPVNRITNTPAEATEGKLRPASGNTVSFPPKPVAAPQNFLDQKLQSSVSLPKEEKRYTSDPYREPLA
ncbi:MAG: hypothetical protein Q7R93_04025 [bacterium]|nr:hypothetical protein [bacterium]